MHRQTFTKNVWQILNLCMSVVIKVIDNSISPNLELSELPCCPSLAKYTTPCQIYFHFNGLPAPSDQWPHYNTGLWLVNEGNIGLWLVEGGTITRMWIQSSHEIGLTFIPQNICVYLDRGYITTKCKQLYSTIRDNNRMKYHVCLNLSGTVTVK